MKKLFTLWTILFIGLTKISACDCGTLGKISIDDYQKAGNIFVGRVISVSVNKKNWEKEVTFEIIDKLKPLEFEKQITIRTALDGAACGL